MGRKGSSAHLKRLASPSFWTIHRKEKTWITRPSPGPHPLAMSIPLLVVIRDVLKFADTKREAEAAIVGRKIKVDDKVRVDKKFPVGLMDLFEVAGTDRTYIVLPSTHRVYRFHPVKKAEKKFKLCRIKGKTVRKGGNVQLNLHDGRNLLVKVADPTRPEEDVYGVLDVVQLNLTNGKIMKHLKFAEGAYAMVIDGENIGRHGTITSVEKHSPTAPRIVKIRGANNVEYNTVADYIFVVGEDKSLISLPEG